MYARIQQLKADPEIILIHGIDEGIIESLIHAGKSGVLQKSTVQLQDGTRALDQARTSSSCHIDKSEELDEIVSDFFQYFESEKPQYLEYQKGQFYLPHFDYFTGVFSGEQRIATMIVYLTDVEQGGETVFPALGITVKPKKGSALLFTYQNEGTKHLTLHEAKPVHSGVKNIVTLFIRKKGNEKL